MNEIYINGLTDSKYNAWKELIDNDNCLEIEKACIDNATRCNDVTITYPECEITFSCRRTDSRLILEFESDDMITILECALNDFASIVIW